MDSSIIIPIIVAFVMSAPGIYTAFVTLRRNEGDLEDATKKAALELVNPLREEVARFRTRCVEMEQITDALKESNSIMEKTIEELQEANLKLEQTIDEMKLTINKKDARINELERLVTEKDERIESLQLEIDELRGRVEEVEKRKTKPRT